MAKKLVQLYEFCSSKRAGSFADALGAHVKSFREAIVPALGTRVCAREASLRLDNSRACSWTAQLSRTLQD